MPEEPERYEDDLLTEVPGRLMEYEAKSQTSPSMVANYVQAYASFCGVVIISKMLGSFTTMHGRKLTMIDASVLTHREKQNGNKYISFPVMFVSTGNLIASRSRVGDLLLIRWAKPASLGCMPKGSQEAVVLEGWLSTHCDNLTAGKSKRWRKGTTAGKTIMKGREQEEWEALGEAKREVDPWTGQ